MPSLDSFHETIGDALAEASRRKSDPSHKDMVVRVEKSGYGGYRVRSTPSDLYIDQLTDSPLLTVASASRYMAGA